MKKHLFFYFLLIICTLTVTAQNRWTVSPTTDFAADFSSIAQACASSQVQAGDLLMVHGGYYGNDTINKPVGIVGTGYFLGDNVAEDIQANSTSARFNSLIIQNTANNSYITGVEVYILSIFGTDIFINKCKVNGVFYLESSSETITVEQSYITNGFRWEGFPKNVILKNNYIGLDSGSSNGSYSFTGVGFNNPKLNGVIRNNVIKGRLYPNTVQYAQFQNNIFTAESGVFTGGTGPIFTNNVFVEPLSNTEGNGNQYEVDATTLFVGATNNSTDGQWQLAEDSPAVGAGIGGTDCGMFGGDTPYVLSGLPGIPNIYSLTTPNNTGNNGGMNIEVKVKTNN